jgi:mono/diheme cytochrome c family protein
MMKTMMALVWVSLSALLTGPAQEAFGADVQRGEELAGRWCVQCHAMTPGQRRSDTDPPDFARIARNPGLDPGVLGAFLMTPHPRMPDFSLSRKDVEDLVAFIRSQAR